MYMKKTLLFSTLLVFAIACTDNTDEFVTNKVYQETITRTVPSEVSPYFNWEDIGFIPLIGLQGVVTLPWYSGATTSIPDCILKDYKAVDGWKMIYNFCTGSGNLQEDKFYLIFYNIFSGRLRTFVYNNNDVTSANTTLWKLSFNNKTTLLNDLSAISYAQDTITEQKEVYITNITKTPVKSLTRGWNSFDVDFLMYDKDLPDKNIAMSIDLYDTKQEQIKLAGKISMESEGTMVTVTKTETTSEPKALKKAVEFIGKSAKDFYTNLFDNEGTSSTYSSETRSIGVGALIAGVTSKIIDKGGNWLVKKFSSKKEETLSTSTSDIKITSNGTVQIEGNITSQQQANILPISRLMIPGSKPTIEDIILPSYNEPIGVWNLKTTPVIRPGLYGERMFREIKEISSKGVVKGIMCTKAFMGLESSSVEVMINPSILSCLEKYTVDVKLLIEQKTAINSKNEFFERFCKGLYKNILYFSKSDSILVLQPWSNNIFECGRVLGSYESPFLLNRTLYEAQVRGGVYYGKTKVGLNTPTGGLFSRFMRQMVVKVTVTLYPKAPFNKTPYVTTRTFIPKYNGSPYDFGNL